MELQEWLKWYDKIRTKFGYSIVNDQNATKILSNMIRDDILLDLLKSKLYNKDVIIFGAGPSIEHFDVYDKIKGIMIACDGASEALLKHDIKPDIVITDLDGDHKSLLEADRRGAIMIVHAHGDNVNLMLNLVPRFKHCIGSTQVKPLDNVYNFGGFTDGDRAVFLADGLGARRIILVGMDFGNMIGRYSKSKVSKIVKIEKMKVAKELLEYISARSKAELYNLSPSIINGYKNITVKDLHNILL